MAVELAHCGEHCPAQCARQCCRQPCSTLVSLSVGYQTHITHTGTHTHTHSQQAERECTHRSHSDRVQMAQTRLGGCLASKAAGRKAGKASAVLLQTETQNTHPKQPLTALANQRKETAGCPSPNARQSQHKTRGHEPAHPKQPRAVSHKQGTGWLSRAQGTLCKDQGMPAAAHQPQQQPQGALSVCTTQHAPKTQTVHTTQNPNFPRTAE